eukprot:IDg13020t1
MNATHEVSKILFVGSDNDSRRSFEENPRSNTSTDTSICGTVFLEDVITTSAGRSESDDAATINREEWQRRMQLLLTHAPDPSFYDSAITYSYFESFTREQALNYYKQKKVAHAKDRDEMIALVASHEKFPAYMLQWRKIASCKWKEVTGVMDVEGIEGRAYVDCMSEEQIGLLFCDMTHHLFCLKPDCPPKAPPYHDVSFYWSITELPLWLAHRAMK